MLFFIPLIAVTTLLQALIPGAPTPETFVPMDAAARGTDVSLWILRQFPSTATALTELELALQLGSSNALVYSAPLGLYAWRSFSTVRTLATYVDRLLSPSSAELESRRRSARCGCAPGLAVLPSGTSTGWCISVLTLPAPVPLLSLPAPSPILTLPAPRPVLTLPAPAPILALPAPKPVLSMIVAPVPTFLSTPVRGLYPVATKPVVHSTTRKWHDHLSMACLVVLTLGFQLVANRLFEGFPQHPAVANYLLDDVTETPGECNGLEHALDPYENLATDTSDVERSRRLSGLAHDPFRFCDPSKLPDAALEDTLEAPPGSGETVEGMAGGDTREKSLVPEDASVETEESQGPREVDGAAASSEVPVNNGRLLDSVPGPDNRGQTGDSLRGGRSRDAR
ncbi:hypothetical protein FRC08_005911 [Ceratobasidium sp. 394]|nr:hypothetical protein FRC08_005911 [Ceratobasidium sp. 394]